MSRLALLNGSPVRSRPFPEWPICQPSDEEALLQVLRSGQWSRHQGHRTELFESRFASYQGARFGIGVVNGTIALRLALQTIGIQPGDEVIVPPITFYSTASSVIEVNGVPIFADIDPETYCIDPAAIEAAITSRTRAIIPVHFGGQSAAMDEIIEIARRNQLVVIEDAAHAHGAEYKGKRLGSLGQISAFSFQASKTLSAGEGGIILTSDEHYERICRALHTCGRFPDSAWYEHRILGGNFRMSEFQAALLLTQFNRLEEQVKVREANGLFLNRALAQIPGIKPMARGRGETRHGYYLYIFRYNPVPFDGLPRQTFLKALSAEGIPCSAGYDRPLYQQPVFIHQEFGPYRTDGVHYPDYAGISCPTSEQSCQEACWLAQPVLLGDQGAMQDIVTAVSKIYEHRKDLLEMSVNMN